MSNQLLFHPRTVLKALQAANILKDGAIPAKQLKLLQGWHDAIKDGSIHKQSEGNLHANFYSSLCEGILGYTSFTDKDKKTGVWTLANESAVKKTGRVDIGFGKFTDKEKLLIAPLELKSPKTTNMDIAMLGRTLSTVEQAAKYARNSEGNAQWFVVSNCIELRLYKFPYSDSIYQRWLIEELIQPEKYAEFVLLLSAKNLLGGNTLRWFDDSRQVEKDITNQLYTDYRNIRIKLINGMKRENNRFSRASMVTKAQTLLDRVLFIAYAEDRDLLPQKILNSYLNSANDHLSEWDMLKLLFGHIDQGKPDKGIPKYNGDLFKSDASLEELSISKGLLEEFKRLSAYDFATDVSVTILGHIFEQSIADLDQIYESINDQDELDLGKQQQGTTGKRKQDGVVYTPDFITQWMVKHTLGAYLEKRKQEIKQAEDSAAWWLEYRKILATTKILDPACGSGAFLVAAFQYLKAEYQYLNKRLQELGEKGDLFGIDLNHDILNNNLYGVDINAESVEIARLSLWLATAEKGKPLTSLKDNIRQGNSLIADKSLDKRAFNWHGRFSEFDVILGNPPYVRQERLTPIKPYLEANYATYHGVADLYTYFFELGLRLLKKGGYMGFISSSTFFKTGSGENLRHYLQLESNLKTIIDFGDLQVFEGVTTYPAILIMEKPIRTRKQVPSQDFRFLNVTVKSVEVLPAELDGDSFGIMSQSKLALDGWSLEDERLQQLRLKITRGKTILKEAYSSPQYGIKTGRNTAFVIDSLTRKNLIQADPKSLEIIKPFLEGMDLKKWRAESRDLYLIFTRRGIDISKYPVIKAYLEKFRTLLEPKPKDWPEGKEWLGRKSGTYAWYEIQDSVDYYKNFEKTKISYGHFSPEPLFRLDTKNYYSNDKSYIIPNADHYLLGLLNSNIHWFLIKALCPYVRGGFYEVRTYYIDTLPIPTATDSQKQTIAQYAETCQSLAEQRYQLQNTLRRRIPDLCPADKDNKLSTKLHDWWELDFKAFQAEVKTRFKRAMTLQESIEWEPLFNETKEKIQRLSYQLSTDELALNQAVYALFDLTQTEIDLLEQNLK
ncbi:N-6 DNA methylase [uncultured Thiothrix sp.]|uniref:Eco57I restriction-modification methylase domain-containing protein n=1 Tax=uncultured Thiothrix sp. TaxID=223185 RepID=UPI002603936E|nr:N-6 DNA methylase [uncultured Thiothrix sp.]HMT93460.1 N-6 DNA methylase [Thiolinea sp.]